MITKIFPWHKWHGKEKTGSYRLRFENMLPYWPELADYQYGEQFDVMIYQKVYIAPDWRLMEMLQDKIQILDISDPDWLDWAPIKETLEAVDAVTCPTERMAEFLRQLTDKPVIVIPDRHDLKPVPSLKTHYGHAKKLVWFGYAHNSESLNQCMPFLERNDYHLTVISNSDPSFKFLTANREAMQQKYTYIPYDNATKFEELAKHDICLMPADNRPIAQFKSNNRTTTAYLAGLPVAVTADDIMRFSDAQARNIEARKNYDLARKDYDIKLSVNQYKELINGISQQKNK